MLADFKTSLWLLKLGALVNLYFLVSTLAPPASAASAHILVPAQIFFAVSAFRCLFPVGYKHNVVFHDSPLSSIFLTRLLATFSEVAYIYQLSHVIRLLNADQVGWIDALSWVMVVQVVVSQCFVWSAILTGRLVLYFFEELGWAIIFVANTTASAYLYLTLDTFGGREVLVHLSLLFGSVYLPWQVVHLRLQLSDAKRGAQAGNPVTPVAEGLARSLRERNPTTAAEAWGGLVGLSWMTGYWATLTPMWIHYVVVVLSR